MAGDFTIIIPAFNAETTIGFTLKSIKNQIGFSGTYRVIVVDSHSTDNTVKIVERFFPEALILSCETGGPGRARNLALDWLRDNPNERTEWTTFVDADDWIDPLYLHTLTKLMKQKCEAEDQQINLFVTQLLRVEPTGLVVNNHPLRYRFKNGPIIVDLEHEPAALHTSVATAVFRTSTLTERNSPRFDPDLKYSEDVDFLVKFYRQVGTRIMLASGAKYYYRIGQKKSLTTSAWADEGKYIEPFEKAYLSWIRFYRQPNGIVTLPRWLSWILLYEIHWYLEADRSYPHPCLNVSLETRKQCGSYLSELFQYIPESEVLSFSAVKMGIDRRLAIVANGSATKESRFLGNQVITYQTRGGSEWRRCTWFWSGNSKPELLLSGLKPPETWNKTITHVFYEVIQVHEEVTWRKETDGLKAILNSGKSLSEENCIIRVAPFSGIPHVKDIHGLKVKSARASVLDRYRARVIIQRGIGSTSLFRTHVYVIKKKFHSLSRALVFRAYALMKVGNRNKIGTRDKEFTDKGCGLAKASPVTTWFLMDRWLHANDNAEAFYRFLDTRGFKVYFALSRNAPSWERLRSDGFNLVEPFSESFWWAIHDASYICLSDLSDPSWMWAISSTNPNCRKNGSPLSPHQLVVFLQHGVLRMDLSRLLNPKRIDLMVTSYPDEYESLTKDGSPYKLTAKEVICSGLPRHDILRQKKTRISNRKRVILLAPTWIDSLRDQALGVENDDEVIDNFSSVVSESSFQLWIDMYWKIFDSVKSYSDVEVKLFIHPAYPKVVSEYLSAIHVKYCDSESIQDVLAHTKVAVTDYSSVVEDALILGARVFHWQPVKGSILRKTIPGVTMVSSRSELRDEIIGALELPMSVTIGSDWVNCEKLLFGIKTYQ
ncbi:hypothetical protein BSR29_00505 [Boudabousia liubingyangii]|uniref:Glycosyltransferase 2-like domain-containing protein n=2 Tax=Boudabousia liubingyangii TaxID=1921764 RepID=A0A1Q5PPF0_9ACTO|nr:hypothetical protein BSR29_00505 [Boudabousia liubingyangii]